MDAAFESTKLYRNAKGDCLGVFALNRNVLCDFPKVGDFLINGDL
jgi:hypothetical protein